MTTLYNASLASLRTLVLSLLLAGATAAQDPTALPDIGSSAEELISPAQERAYGRQLIGELRRAGWLLEDPLLDSWFTALGFRLAAHSQEPNEDYSFFLMRSRDINAFATLGGSVGMNAGLILTAQSEDEVAAVLAHEITHVTQRHVVRAVESQKKDSLPIALAMLGAIIAAQQSGGGGDATQAAIAGGIALMQQRQINHTRSSEHEADRIGIQILSRTGYEPLAMADFFGRMQRALRSQGVGPPEFLRTHPVTSTRIAEAKARAEKVGGGYACAPGENGGPPQCRYTRAESEGLVVGAYDAPLHPAFPYEYRDQLSSAISSPDRQYAWARERVLLLTSDSPQQALTEYDRQVARGEPLSDAQEYGRALALTRMGRPDSALGLLEDLSNRHPDFYWLDLAIADATQRAGRRAEADAMYANLLRSQPSNRAIALTFAQSLVEIGTPDAGRQAQDVLRPLLAQGAYDAVLQQAFARASEIAGDVARAGEAYAETALLSGRAEDALNQLQRLKEQQDLDYVQRSRIDARIAAITPLVLELRAQGIRADGERRRRLEVGLGTDAALR